MENGGWKDGGIDGRTDEQRKGVAEGRNGRDVGRMKGNEEIVR